MLITTVCLQCDRRGVRYDTSTFECFGARHACLKPGYLLLECAFDDNNQKAQRELDASIGHLFVMEAKIEWLKLKISL